MFLFVINLFLLAACNDEQSTDNSCNADYSGDNSATISIDSNNDSSQDSSGSNEKYIVKFFNEDDLISSEEVSSFKELTVPKITIPNSFFKEWEGFPEALADNYDLKAVFDKTESTKNAIGFDSVYIGSGEEFAITMRITGIVDFCGVSFEIIFEDDQFEFIDVVEADEYAVYKYNETSKSLKYEFVCSENILTDVDLCKIKIKPGSLNGGSQLNVMVKDCFKFNNSNDDVIDADYTLFNEKIIVMGA